MYTLLRQGPFLRCAGRLLRALWIALAQEGTCGLVTRRFSKANGGSYFLGRG